jgi:hypothetical protein
MNPDFDNLLRDGMERFTDDLRAPINLADRARRSRQQRLTLRTTAGGLAAAAVAAIAFAVLPSEPAPVVGNSQPHVPERFDVEYLHLTMPKHEFERLWAYGSRVRAVYGSSGRAIEDYGTTTSPMKAHDRRVVTIVDYRHKIWARGKQRGYPAPHPISCHPASLTYPIGPSSLPAWIRGVHKLIKCGELVVTGSAEINGVPTIRLRTTISFETGPGSKGTIWVKRTNFVPVRIEVGKGGSSWRMDLQWLRPTKPNRAQLRVPIPHGFHRVSINRLAGSSSETCQGSSSHPHKMVCKHSG